MKLKCWPPWLLSALLFALAIGGSEAMRHSTVQPADRALPHEGFSSSSRDADGARRQLLSALTAGSPGVVPQAIVNAFNPANNRQQGQSAASVTAAAAVSSDGGVSAAAAAAPSFGASQYKQVLGLSYLFYEAQRSGKLPATNRVPWRGSCHLSDRVVGGYMDAGDGIKHALTIGEVVTFLAWSAIDFKAGHVAAGQLSQARAAVKWGADYLSACRVSNTQFVGLIGDPAVDHAYWGRPEDYQGARKAFLWNRTNAASDMLGMTAAALASSSVLFRPDSPAYADQLLARAKQIYQWAVEVPGIYSQSYPGYPDVYQSSRYNDKLMLAAGWLYRATGNATYLSLANKHYKDAGGRWQINPYVSYDALYVPAVALLISVGYDIGGSKVPGFPEYLDFYRNTFVKVWSEAKGDWAIVSTPKGMRFPSWSQWGNLRHANNAAFCFLLYAQNLPAGTANRAAAIKFAKSQVDYALGSSGRSFVVGFGTNPPTHEHHRGASCPNRPATCDWSAFNNPGPNPQVLHGALVAGPKGPGDDTYYDRRDDYVSNEVAIDYNAGFTGALAGLLSLTP